MPQHSWHISIGLHKHEENCPFGVYVFHGQVKASLMQNQLSPPSLRIQQFDFLSRSSSQILGGGIGPLPGSSPDEELEKMKIERNKIHLYTWISQNVYLTNVCQKVTFD